jgi:DNA polymerase III delta prime subunit
LEKPAEEAAEKRPRLEGGHSETNDVNFHSASVAIDSNPLLKHRSKLAAFYFHQPEVPEGTWPPVKKTQYINLALIKTEQAIDFNKELLRQTIRGSIDDIMKDKDDIKYDEVFIEVEEGARLLFEGRPGCGKTTMMNKVSQDWAKWKIFSSCLLFLVHLRRFGNRSDITLENVLRSTPVEFSDEEFQELTAQIKSTQGKGIVFALDGLDEYCPDKKEMKISFIHKLIKGQILPKSIVIVASRPAASQRYRRNATKCIEVLGFLKDQIYEYINSYFDGNKDSLVVGLRTYLEHHPNVMHMCYLPLHMAMVTYLYELEGASLPQTETEIYRHFTLYTLLRSIRKRNDTEMEIGDEEEFCFSCFDDLQLEDRRIFDCILKFAYEATVVNPQQVFSAEEVKKITTRRSNDTANNDNSLGLVVVDKYFVRYGLKEIYTFLHLTFQEFLSACYIVQLSSQAQEEIILKYGGDKRLGVVWKFYCGMTQFLGEKMRNFERLVKKIKSEVLLHLRCAHESQQDILCAHTINSYGSKIVLNSSSLNPADFTALGYVLTHSNVPATELAITSCNVGPEGLSALEKAINTSSPPLRILR